MASRGKRLVQLAIEKIISQKARVETKTDINNNTLDTYRIQGCTIVNTNTALLSEEQLPQASELVANIDNDKISEVSENDSYTDEINGAMKEFYDTDDTANDPDWRIDSRKKHRLTSSSSEDSEDENPNRNRKRKKTLEKIKTLPTTILEIPKTDLRNVQEKANACIQLHHEQEKVEVAQQHVAVYVDHEETVETQPFENLTETISNTDNSGTETPQALSDTTTINDREQVNNQSTRLRKGMGNKDTWKRNIEKRLRMTGRSYKGLKKVDGKKKYCVDKGERIMGERNCGNRCRKSRKCFEVSEETRKSIFSSFWSNMDWQQKKVYAVSLVSKSEAGKTSVGSKRKYTYRYYIRKGEEKFQVCKNLFLSTFGIGERTLTEWLKKSDQHGLPSEKVPEEQNTEKFTTEKAMKVKEFLNKLPKMLSHYCRSTSNKSYLEPEFRDMTSLYNLYKHECINEPVGRTLLEYFGHLI
ncbi:uncharacterized protein LOC128547331 [Mercenaria mercenaria]|uniref:uncharacterized protein LOC128547331 n=1 Tax=Mercenaria mercenaria TaxID=6596 RepID=UPI00234F9556|nr:uncharacterized protein LOC128547331 [Mercenaria mercenaria]